MSAPGSSLLFLRTRRSLRRSVVRDRFRRIAANVASGRPMNCLVTDDRELQRLNREFLGKDYPTDVLSFPASGSAESGGFLGEIAISEQRAREQAAAYGHPVEDEIGVLLLHGVLHLLGMDHERDKGEMKRAEKIWRARLGLPHGLMERKQRC